MVLNMVLANVVGMKEQIDDFLKSSTYDKHADLRGLHVDSKDSDQLFQLRELKVIMRKLADIAGSIEYLLRPVLETGTLHKDESGEYRTEKGYCYRSGSLIEVLLQDDLHEVPCWIQTKVEHDGEDYYLVGYDDISMEGQEVEAGFGILTHEEGVQFLPANIDLAAVEVSLISAMSREYMLKEYIETVAPYYDYIIIDCLCGYPHKQSNAE